MSNSKSNNQRHIVTIISVRRKFQILAMGDSNKLSTSDDEDLEALRLAALSTIKKKNAALNGSTQPQHHFQRSPEKPNRFNRSMNNCQNKKTRFFGSHQGRNGKNGQFNTRSRNPNLIAIPTMAPEDEEKAQEKPTGDGGVSVNLPQNRYCNVKEEKKDEVTSKFNRYNKSDESESETEEEEASEDESPGKLHKADSLEALMQELDDEIQGKTKTKDSPTKTEKPKAKKIKKKKRSVSERVSTSDSDAKQTEPEKMECEVKVEVIKHSECDTTTGPSETSVNCDKVEVKPLSPGNKPLAEDTYSPARKRPRSRSPVGRRPFQNRRRPRNFQKFPIPPPQNLPYIPPIPSYAPPVLPFSSPPFNPLFAPPNVAIMNQPPPFFERPLSPLAINAESLTTATLAPLSPRSAAFVLENKAIIERRRRSPRRSYSRSRSPSRSPRRSLTPRRLPRRSVSPRRMSRSPRRLSRSPRRRSLSPRRRSLSPRRRNVPKSRENSPKNRPPVRERLGVKSKAEEVKEKPKETPSSPKKDEKPLDPILEARKRKFESNEIKKREGIIRLKPKDEKLAEKESTPPVVDIVEEKPKEQKEELPKESDVMEELENLLKEDALLEPSDDIDLHPKAADIFSDEDSASDNEGRFKVKERTNAKPPVLSFTKLVNGEKRDIKAEALPDSKRIERRRDRRERTERSHTRSQPQSTRKDPPKENSKTEGEKKSVSKKAEEKPKSAVSVKSERHVTPMEKRFERKIEIKIKNPSKYERGSGKLKSTKDGEKKTREEAKRKVELGDKEEVEVHMEEEEEEEPEIIVENNSGDEENSAVNEGDLRAQLSKKRAGKLYRGPIEGVSSRLLQNALQGAVFKKTKKKSKEQDITSSDGKLPIHLRLGIATNSDIFSTSPTKSKRKSRKRKNRETLEQPIVGRCQILRHF